MDITFSEKYEPLFKVLSAWDEDKGSEYSQIDTILISGGRDSGKSWALEKFMVIAARDYGHRILNTRYTMSASSNSTATGIKSSIELMGYESDFIQNGSTFDSSKGKGKIVIMGQKTSSGTQTAKMKSLSDFSIFSTEEAEEITSFEEWKKVKRSIRSRDVQPLSILCFNPTVKSHFLYQEFYQNVPVGFNGIIGSCLYIHTTYLDNGQQNMTKSNWEDYEGLRLSYETYLSLSKEEKDEAPRRLKNRYKEYLNTCLGCFRESAEGQVFEYTLGDYVEPEYEQMYGMDQGYNDPTTCVAVNLLKDQKKIYVKEIFYKRNQVAKQVFDGIKSEVGNSRIWVDSAAAMFIAELKSLGLNAKSCNKPKIVDSINALLSYELIVDPRSTNLIQELDLYTWSESKPDTPVDRDNHAIDALRYVATHLITSNRGSANRYKIYTS